MSNYGRLCTACGSEIACNMYGMGHCSSCGFDDNPIKDDNAERAREHISRLHETAVAEFDFDNAARYRVQKRRLLNEINAESEDTDEVTDWEEQARRALALAEEAIIKYESTVAQRNWLVSVIGAVALYEGDDIRIPTSLALAAYAEYLPEDEAEDGA